MLLLALLLSCATPPDGLRATPPGTGPEVRVDWDAEPLPDIPFPNDLATRPDPTSPTGLRLNLPEEADIALERHTRAEMNTFAGFGIFSPILVGFDAGLDVEAVRRRHPDDFHDPAAFADDAIYLIDVDPDSPDYLRPVPLELGHGRFPQDAARLGSFLPNDPRADHPSLLFETAEEDVNGNGVLDPGEDTDGDGILDHPNVWPPGGDPRADLLTWYDLGSHTLLLRPVVPLREETRYAVVLTEALVGVDGQPVRSPWAWVNHTRQTEALLPAVDALEALGRSVDDIAYAWTFTTGRVTRDLWDVAEGLRGRGPFARLASAYPPGVVEAHELHTAAGLGDPLSLPIEQIVPALEDLGLLPASSIGFLGDAYLAFTDTIVGGTFTSPDLLADKDDGGRDSTDEHWQLDATTGELFAAPRRVAFTCAIPKARDDVQPPFPVALHAHGYGSSRVELIFFAYALNRMGIAVCGIDAPGQGLDLSDEEAALAAGVLGLSDAAPLWWHILDNRVRDLDNDGRGDPAGDTFPADALHARDVLRQPIVDQVQLVRTLRACGTGTMERVLPTVDGIEPTGEEVLACDWDGDGEPDLGGPDTEILLHGVSQGGIMSALSAAILDAEAAVLTVPGGGLADVIGRTEISRVSDGMVGRALSPLILGIPRDGGLDVVQLVVTVDRTAEVHVAHLPEIPAGGSVVVRNLTLGKVDQGPIPADGRFRVPIAANALDPHDKAVLTGIPEGGVRLLEVYEAPDNEGLGDRLEVEVRDAGGRTVAVLDTFAEDVVHEGVTYRAGSPLVAASWGLGMRRGSYDLQRLVSVLAVTIEPGDPISYARRWAAEPFDGNPRKVMIHLTAGDSLVPIATGFSLARAAGLVDYTTVDPRYGTTADRFLIETATVQGLEQYGPWEGPDGAPILYDVDDLDEGLDETGAPSAAPLRSTVEVADGLSALRVLYVDPRGSHAYMLPDESLPFDWSLYGAQQMAWFLATRGGDVADETCLATRDCPFLPPFPVFE